MADDRVTVKASGQSFDAWEAVHVRASIGEAARSFRVTAAAEDGLTELQALFPLWTPVDVSIGADLVCRGYVDERRATLSKDRGEVRIGGRSKSQDLIDCSAIHPTGRMEDVTLADVAGALDQFGVGFSTEEALSKIPLVQITPGETGFAVLNRLAEAEGGTLAGQPDGSVAFWTAKRPKKHAGGLIQGQTVMHIEGGMNARKRHSKHHVRGQRARGMASSDLEVEATASDRTVPRYRPLITSVQDDIDHGRAGKRARRHRDHAAGRGLTAVVKVPTWRDDDGTLWTPGWLIWTESSFVGIVQDMLIEHVDFHMSGSEGGGKVAELHLVDPRAYGGRKGKGRKSAKAWDMDESNVD